MSTLFSVFFFFGFVRFCVENVVTFFFFVVIRLVEVCFLAERRVSFVFRECLGV